MIRVQTAKTEHETRRHETNETLCPHTRHAHQPAVPPRHVPRLAPTAPPPPAQAISSEPLPPAEAMASEGTAAEPMEVDGECGGSDGVEPPPETSGSIEERVDKLTDGLPSLEARATRGRSRRSSGC